MVEVNFYFLVGTDFEGNEVPSAGGSLNYFEIKYNCIHYFPMDDYKKLEIRWMQKRISKSLFLKKKNEIETSFLAYVIDRRLAQGFGIELLPAQVEVIISRKKEIDGIISSSVATDEQFFESGWIDALLVQLEKEEI